MHYSLDLIVSHCKSLKIEILEQKAFKKIKTHPWNEHLNVFLFLFPVDDKKEFVKDLHLKLKGAQQG